MVVINYNLKSYQKEVENCKIQNKTKKAKPRRKRTPSYCLSLFREKQTHPCLV